MSYLELKDICSLICFFTMESSFHRKQLQSTLQSLKNIKTQVKDRREDKTRPLLFDVLRPPSPTRLFFFLFFIIFKPQLEHILSLRSTSWDEAEMITCRGFGSSVWSPPSHLLAAFSSPTTRIMSTDGIEETDSLCETDELGDAERCEEVGESNNTLFFAHCPALWAPVLSQTYTNLVIWNNLLVGSKFFPQQLFIS